MTRLFLLAGLCLALTGCQKCIRSHNEMVHHNGWMQMMPIYNGKTTTFIPIYHPAYDAEEVVCDQYAE